MRNNVVIEILPQSVVEKIAAGEVIERPASVLKELIENSIDAGATKIDITIEDAGFALIRIVDNGWGMSPENLRKSLLRHATSKIRTADDLFSIATMGFRGEALASVSAVSRMSLSSADQDSGLGYSISCDGGVTGEMHPVQHLKGTSISVRDLFFNVPARKKFMKSRRSEHLAIMRLMEQLVIPFPGIHFTLTVDGKRELDLPATDTPLGRISDVAGVEMARHLIECKSARNGLDVFLYVSTPEHLQHRPRFQSLYVNLRRIDNDSVTYAIRESFSQFLGLHQRPNFFCFLDVDPGRIDVNVHPTKQQVKFDDERELFGFIFHTVKSGISSHVVHRTDLGEPAPSAQSTVNEKQEDAVQTTLPWETTAASELTSSAESIKIQFGKGSSFFSSSAQEMTSRAPEKMPDSVLLPFPGKSPEKEIDQTRDNTVQLTRDDREQAWDLIPCYQIHGMFVLAPIKNGILLIDQHAAHERVLYEQALEDVKRGRSVSQPLLFPIIVELTPTERAVVETGKEFFRAFGFEIDEFGGKALSVSAIPVAIKDGAVEDTIRGMIKYLLEGRTPDPHLETEKRFAAAFACGAAIKFGQKLSQEEMNALLNALFSTKNPYTCPHGRPTLVRLSTDELSRRFLR